jgi:hypothetical protein
MLQSSIYILSGTLGNITRTVSVREIKNSAEGASFNLPGLSKVSLFFGRMTDRMDCCLVLLLGSCDIVQVIFSI